MKRLINRFGYLIAGLTFSLSILGLSSGIAFAAAPPPPNPVNSVQQDQRTIDGLYLATRVAVDNLQKTPVGIQVLADALIIGGAKISLSHLNDPSSPGTVVGGLDLDGYCQSIGDVNSYTPVPGVETTGGAYTWSCVSTTGAQTTIDMQAACTEQYPGQLTVAYAQDPNNSYSWVCMVPTAGAFTDPVTGATVDSITTANSAAMLVSQAGSEYLTIVDGSSNNNTASDILTIQGETMAYNNKMISNNSALAASAASSALKKLDGFNGGL